jgi:hypothetical protein
MSVRHNCYHQLTAIDNICFYVQSELFQQRTEESVNALLDHSELAIDRLAHLNIEAETIQTKM